MTWRPDFRTLGLVLKSSMKSKKGMREAIKDKITIEDFEFDIINSLVNFLYTSKLEVTSDNVFAMYQASDLYEIETARNFCSQFLVDSLTHRNCFELFFAARLYTNKRLMNEIIKFISCHIDFISKSDGFLRLNIEDICQLFNSESFIFTSETELFKSILAWVCLNMVPFIVQNFGIQITHDENNRSEHLEQLFKIIRLNHLPPKFLIKHVRTNPMVQKSQLCLNRIMDTYEHIILPPDNTVSELGGVKRLEIHRDDMKLTEPEDIDPGPNVKVFDQMVSILGIEFHISPGTIERLNRGPPHGLPHGHGPMGGFFRWELVVYIWCDFSKTWEMTVKTAITVPVGTNSSQGTFKLPFKKVIQKLQKLVLI